VGPADVTGEGGARGTAGNQGAGTGEKKQKNTKKKTLPRAPFRFKTGANKKKK